MQQDSEHSANVSVLNWLGTIILTAIPVVNLIMAIVWAIACKPGAKRNFAIALVILYLLGLIALFLLLVPFGPQTTQALTTFDTWLKTVLGA